MMAEIAYDTFTQSKISLKMLYLVRYRTTQQYELYLNKVLIHVRVLKHNSLSLSLSLYCVFYYNWLIVGYHLSFLKSNRYWSMVLSQNGQK